MPLAPSHPFGLLDWIVVAAYGSVLLGIGFYFARRQRTSEEFFVGNRSTRPFLAGVSFFAATSSIISYIGNPGEYVQNGPGLIFFAPLVVLPILQVLVGRWFIPAIMRLPITSAYELLQNRLGLSVRRTGSITFIVTRFVWMALILYTSSTILVSILGCDPRWKYLFTFATGAVTITYTVFGGIRSVMVTEVVQFFLLLLGAILTIVSISFRLGGVAAWWPTHWEPHWSAQPFFSLDPHVRVSFVLALTYYIIAYVCSAASDQAAVQRFLTTRDAAAARRAYLMNNLANATVSIVLGLVGMAILAFYRVHREAAPAGLTFARDGDAFFPLYIGHFLPAGISGLLVASLLASAMSCFSSGINATITVVTKDFIETARGHVPRGPAAELRLTRLLALAIGLIVIFGSIAMGSVHGNLFEVSTKTINLLFCPLFGLFFLAMFVPFATPFGAIMGALYSTAAAVVIGYWDALTGLPNVAFLLVAPVSLAASLGAGLLLSLLPTRGRSGAVLAGYTAASLAPVAAVFVWLTVHFR